MPRARYTSRKVCVGSVDRIGTARRFALVLVGSTFSYVKSERGLGSETYAAAVIISWDVWKDIHFEVQMCLVGTLLSCCFESFDSCFEVRSNLDTGFLVMRVNFST